MRRLDRIGEWIPTCALLALACGLAACASGTDPAADGGSDADATSIPVCGNGVVEVGEDCDDGNAAGGDGCSAHCKHEGCNAGTCPNGCCDMFGACVYGTQDLACGTGGAPCENCATDGGFCQEQVCEAAPDCTAGETRACGNCGFRTCNAAGFWGECQGQGDCAPGSISQGGLCGNCGSEQVTCQTDCTWTAPVCISEGDCAPGSIQLGGACGTGGTEQQVCDSACRWGAVTCEGEGTCTPNDTQTLGSCGNCGTLTQVCNAGGTWDPATCEGQGVCAPSTTQHGNACGDCGIEEIACNTSCQWDPPVCTNEGVCTPGTTQTGGACGVSGTEEQTCNTTCQWDPPVCVGDTGCGVAGHMGPGENGDPCTEPAETWRCAASAYWGRNISQVCRNGVWNTYHTYPPDCEDCCDTYTAATCGTY